MRITSILLLFLCIPLCLLAQQATPDHIQPGYWTGALIRDGSVQLLTAEFFHEAETLRVETAIPDWVYYGPRKSVVALNDAGQLTFGTYYGEARVVLDTIYQEMVGHVGAHEPAVQVHLKKSFRPPMPAARQVPLGVTSGDVALAGDLFLPEGPGPHPALIYVQGRGCGPRWNTNNKARLLARYGIAAYAFDKRGTGGSSGDCDTATLQDLAGDVMAVMQTLADRPEIDVTRIGLQGGSAGAWVVQYVATRSPVPVAFIVTMVGPATSVKQQQSDNARYITTQLGLDEATARNAQRYVDLMFDLSGEPLTQLAEMKALRADAEATGWDDFFAPTDLADTPEELANLWVRRHNYDPAGDLEKIRVPYLAMFGETDDVVPIAENIPPLRRLQAGNPDLHIVVLKGTGHGGEHGHKLRELPGPKRTLKTYYWKYDRVAAGVMQEVVDFLQRHVIN